VAWLFVCHPHKLTERQRKQLEIVCQAGLTSSTSTSWRKIL
jgi:hypothetical protein